MSLRKLLQLTETLRNQDRTSPEYLARMKAMRERLRVFDAECAERARARIPTAEQLRKVCDWHSRND